MNREELEAWGKAHNYPQLVLGKHDIVSPGKFGWTLLLNDTSGRISKALERIEAFKKRVECEKVGV